MYCPELAEIEAQQQRLLAMSLPIMAAVSVPLLQSLMQDHIQRYQIYLDELKAHDSTTFLSHFPMFCKQPPRNLKIAIVLAEDALTKFNSGNLLSMKKAALSILDHFALELERQYEEIYTAVGFSK